jgi:hypothetical protein
MSVEVAGWCAIVAGAVMVASGVFLAAFFATGRDALGRANDATSAVFAILLVPAVLAVGDLTASLAIWSTVTVVLGLVGVGLVALTSLLTAAGKLTVEQLTKWQGGAFVVLMAWVIVSSLVGLASGLLPSGLCLLGLAAGVLAATAAISIGFEVRRVGMTGLSQMTRPPLVPMLATLGAAVVLPLWSIWLGVSLLQMA